MRNNGLTAVDKVSTKGLTSSSVCFKCITFVSSVSACFSYVCWCIWVCGCGCVYVGMCVCVGVGGCGYICVGMCEWVWCVWVWVYVYVGGYM